MVSLDVVISASSVMSRISEQVWHTRRN